MDPRNRDTAMAWFRSGAIQPGQDMTEAEDLERRALEIKRAFEMCPGALETILAMTVFRPPVNYALPRDGTFENYALVREGQNQVAAALLHYLDQAEKLERRANAPAPISAHVASDDDGAGRWDWDGPGGGPGSDAALSDPGVHVR